MRSRSDLLVQRGRLLERIALQRQMLAQEVQPALRLLHGADRLVAWVHTGVSCARRHPLIPALALAGLFVIKVRRAWRWARRGVLAWQAWQTLRQRFSFVRRKSA